MKAKHIVVLPYDLVLEGVKWGTNGELQSGWVVNGSWYFEIINGKCYAKHDKKCH